MSRRWKPKCAILDVSKRSISSRSCQMCLQMPLPNSARMEFIEFTFFLDTKQDEVMEQSRRASANKMRSKWADQRYSHVVRTQMISPSASAYCRNEGTPAVVQSSPCAVPRSTLQSSPRKSFSTIPIHAFSREQRERTILCEQEAPCHTRQHGKSAPARHKPSAQSRGKWTRMSFPESFQPTEVISEALSFELLPEMTVEVYVLRSA